jgi:hypothetical protein
VWKENVAQFLEIGRMIVRNVGRGILMTIDDIREAGENLAERMKDGWVLGMQRVKSGIINAALAPFTNAIFAVKQLLGIASPSKLFEELGAFTGEGFAIGLRGETANVAQAGASMGQAAIAGASSSVTTNYNLNVATTTDTSNVINDFNMMQAWAGA